MVKFRFSVWTPTYNRAVFLQRLYQSLVNQSFKNFEWIIIDDGSTDDTKAIVDSFLYEKKLKSIRYVKKNNGGKHTAWRVATDLFEADYVITIDSDDTLTENALEIFDKHWNDLENTDLYDKFWEVKGRVQTKEGKMIGKPLPMKVFDSNYEELTYKYKIKAEMQACRKTTVLKNEAKIPESFAFDDYCNNFPESIRWSRAGKIYKSRYIDEIVRTYYFDADNAFSKSNRKSRSIKNTYNYLVGTKYTLEECRKPMFRWNKFAYLQAISVLLYTSFCLSKNPFKIVSPNYFLDWSFLFIGYIPFWIIFKIRG